MQAESTGSLKTLEWLAWLETNARQVALGALIVAILGGGVFFYNYRQAQNEAAAYNAVLLLQAEAGRANPSSTDLLKVQADYAGTAAARQAGFLAAGALFAEGKPAEAQAEFDKFIRASAEDPLTPQAALGSAACLEAQKNLDAALAAYQGVIDRHPNEGVAIQAKLAVGRIQETKGQHADALKLYQDVARSPNMTAWQGEFANRRDDLLRRFPQLAPTNAPAVPSVNIPGTTPAAEPK